MSERAHRETSARLAREAKKRGVSFSERDLLQWTAKAVGVRRAEGKFVIVSNADVLVAAGLGAWLRTRPFADHALVSANTPHYSRRLVGGGGGDMLALPRTASVEQLRRACRVDPRSVRLTEPDYRAQANRVFPGDFQVAHRDVWRRLRGYAELEVRPDVALQLAALHLGVPTSFIPQHVVCHQHHDNEDESDVGVQDDDGSRVRLAGADWGLVDLEDQLQIVHLASHSTLRAGATQNDE